MIPDKMRIQHALRISFPETNQQQQYGELYKLEIKKTPQFSIYLFSQVLREYLWNNCGCIYFSLQLCQFGFIYFDE